MASGLRFHLHEPNDDTEARLTRKRQRIVRSNATPILPSLCAGIHIASLIVPALFFIAEIATWRNRENPSISIFLRGSSSSAFFSWIILGGPSIVLSLAQLYRLKFTNYKEYFYIFKEELPRGDKLSQYTRIEPPNVMKKDERLVLYMKPVTEQAKRKYFHYILSTAALGICLCLYFIITLVCTRLR